MKILKVNYAFRKTLLALCCLGAFAAASAKATTEVTWDLNPDGLNAALGGTSHPYTVSGATITAYGYDNAGGPPNTPHELFYKNGGVGEFGLGITGTTDNELEVNGNGVPLQYIQLDLSSILGQGFTNGEIEVGSVQTGESFVLFGSNTLGSLGTQIGGVFGSTFSETFVAVPNFGAWNYVSVAARAGDVMPVAFRALGDPVPEPSTFYLILSLCVAASAHQLLRRRQRAGIGSKV